ncbi:MAG: DUF262 domain-containing protein [Bacteroidales bacterium]
MNKYSFLDVLEKEIEIEENKFLTFEKIEIPMIQRDYAHGRENEKEIRTRFLNAIFDSLSNENDLDLDFVYGSVSESNKTFIPLDGQQRLTTLYLLYWYIGSRELDGIEYDNLMSNLRKFTYSTRVSSRRFCEELVKTKLVFKNEPNEMITNLSWFFKSYLKDPTISSMLNMLNAIHQKYLETNNFDLFNKLNRLQFYILSLNGFNLTEELYVKMNARGKQLTDFENLKADITKWMKDDKNPYKEHLQYNVIHNNRTMPYFLSFSQKIDNEWSLFFWNITKDYDVDEKDKNGNLIYPEGKIVDPLLLRVFYRYFLNKYIHYSDSDSKIIDKEIEYQVLNKEDKYYNFNPLLRVLSNDNVFTSFENCFDGIVNNWEKIFVLIQPSWLLTNKWSFFDRNFTQKDRIIFLGITVYFETNNFDEVRFKQWMRTVWNIVENTDVTDASSMIGVMKLISELSFYSNDIYAFLADDKNQITSLSSKIAVNEERLKSKFIIIPDTNWENSFINAEKHPFFKGSIRFIISEEMTEEIFNHRAILASKVFDNKGIVEEYRNNGHIFLRALISRFDDSSLIGQNFTDTDESEHYLKKMLSSNDTVRNATREWFSLEDEFVLKEKLEQEVSKESFIPGWSNNDVSERNRIKRAHEALYKSPDLQNWMQLETRKIRFAWSGSHLWISRPRSWYDWIMLDSQRNEIISKLIEKGYSLINDCRVGMSNYFIGSSITLTGKHISTETILHFTFNNNNILSISYAESKEVIKLKEYDYSQEDVDLMSILEDEIFDEMKFIEIITK